MELFRHLASEKFAILGYFAVTDMASETINVAACAAGTTWPRSPHKAMTVAFVEADWVMVVSTVVVVTSLTQMEYVT